MLNVLQDPSVDIEVHVGSDGAPEEVWTAMDLLVRPLSLSWSTSSEVATKSDNANVFISDGPIDAEVHLKQSASPA